ncbi:hypothetical protein F9C07_2077582 [Aspergillus flavus]|uniref:Uncharacterized protein n=1 Tax=Aspergillus flavus (strain ATCC 200026 / FGSC A1120 / IAM 13836 / NRRL 3357 / JCM 12722 / SRRC 167) TaxID=332952 RepID=A0A7U2N0B9_ASPFN|nr:hypothetical protein F9C07_2077582 [Aspergillus flavus]
MFRIISALHQASLCIKILKTGAISSTIISTSITRRHHYRSALLSSTILSQITGNSFDLESVPVKQKQSRESPLTRRHKDVLRELGFTGLHRLGGNGFQAMYDWTHGDYPGVLERHNFLKHAGYADPGLNVSPSLLGDNASTDRVTVDVTLQRSTNQSLETVTESIRELTGQHEAAVTTNEDTSTLHVAVRKEQVIEIARLRGVNTVHEAYEQVPYSNVARRIFKVDEAETSD